MCRPLNVSMDRAGLVLGIDKLLISESAHVGTRKDLYQLNFIRSKKLSLCYENSEIGFGPRGDDQWNSDARIVTYKELCFFYILVPNQLTQDLRMVCCNCQPDRTG